MGRTLRDCCLGIGLWSLVVVGTWVAGSAMLRAQGSDAESLFGAGLKSFQEGNKPEAVENFERLFAQQPSNDLIFRLVQEATVATIVRMARDEDTRIAGIGHELLEMASKSYRRAIDDSEAIARAVQQVLQSDGTERLRLMIEYASRFGRNLVPALIPVLGDSDIGNRATALIWITHHIGKDAIPPLTVAFQHPNNNVRTNIAKVLGARSVRHEYSLAFLKAMLETDENSQVQQEAKTAIEAILGDLEDSALGRSDAKQLFLRNARSLFLSPHANPFDRSTYSAKIYRLDGDQVVAERVARFQFSERMAQQNLELALQLDPGYEDAVLLNYLNDCSQIVKYDKNLAWYASQDSQDDDREILETQKDVMESVTRLRTVAVPASLLVDALRQALSYKRPEVAQYVIQRIRERHLEGPVPGSLIDALEDESSRLVRIAAAVALAEWNPQKDFDAGKQVISILSSAVVQSGIRTAVKAMGSQALANRFDAVLDELNMESNFHLATVAEAYQTITELPPDLILVDEQLKLGSETDPVKSVNRFIVELREGRNSYRTADVPIIVVVDPERLAQASDLYADAEKKVWVVPANIDAVTLRKTITGPLFADKEDDKALAVKLAEEAAIALEGLASAPSPRIAVEEAVDSLAIVLSNRPDSVRIPCLRTLAALGAAAEPRVAEVVQVFANVDNEIEVRSAAMQAVGRILEAGSGKAPKDVAQIILLGTRETDLRLRRSAWTAFGSAGFSAEEQLALLLSAPAAVSEGAAAGDAGAEAAPPEDEDEGISLGDDDDDEIDLGDDDDSGF
ncbi:MAG: HEAT repeat domain-containing protein [Planctomycetes bacterium]|nr:HEAT repeat domain-containing protein [Planctomycetota bacterium]